MTEIGDVLGVSLEKEEEMLDEDIEQLLKERVEARKNKNFARADEIRDQLENDGILLEDTPQGTRWKRK
jgi:cysteinyl-tRNA synthetase